MKCRHAATLALVGWYLMLPPLQFVGPANDPYSLAIVDSAAPLSRWLPKMTFKTLQECDNFSIRLARNMRKSVKTERDKKDVEMLGIGSANISASRATIRGSRKTSAWLKRSR
jgi:hypothetical protein